VSDNAGSRPVIFLLAVAAITIFTIARQPVASAIGLATILTGLAAWLFAYGRRG